MPSDIRNQQSTGVGQLMRCSRILVGSSIFISPLGLVDVYREHESTLCAQYERNEPLHGQLFAFCSAKPCVRSMFLELSSDCLRLASLINGIMVCKIWPVTDTVVRIANSTHLTNADWCACCWVFHWAWSGSEGTYPRPRSTIATMRTQYDRYSVQPPPVPDLGDEEHGSRMLWPTRCS